MSVLVTGGTGYIGSHTCVELLKKGIRVIALDNLSNSSPLVINRIEKISDSSLTFYKCDIRNKHDLEKIFASESIETVIHFAGLKSVGESSKNPLEYYENNIAGTINLLNCMKKHSCKKIVFSSSATVYGSHNKAPFKETDPTGKTTNPYGTTKLYIERILKDLYKSDKSWKISLLRYFNPIGAHESGLIGEDPNGVPSNIMPYISQVAIGKLPYLNVFGNDYPTPDGTGIRDYIHVVDLALGHIAALNRLEEESSFRIYNLGTGIGYSVLDLIKAFQKTTGVKIPYRISERRSGDIAVSFSDPTKANNELGWHANRDLEKMCEDTWRWQKNNPNGYNT